MDCNPNGVTMLGVAATLTGSSRPVIFSSMDADYRAIVSEIDLYNRSGTLERSSTYHQSLSIDFGLREHGTL